MSRLAIMDTFILVRVGVKFSARLFEFLNLYLSGVTGECSPLHSQTGKNLMNFVNRQSKSLLFVLGYLTSNIF